MLIGLMLVAIAAAVSANMAGHFSSPK